ncbi:MAG: SMI1/KNR4 family protein [Ruminococcus sp.]|nr:SMI1/KNR4 family protein [Ruminococcus sp.]
MNIEKIKSVFSEYQVSTVQTEIQEILQDMGLPESLNAYLQLISEPIKMQTTGNGAVLTSLMSQNEMIAFLQDEKHHDILYHELFPLGMGLNEDILCINLKNGHTGYIYYHDFLQGYEDIRDIYQELPMMLDAFLEMAFRNRNYPVEEEL